MATSNKILGHFIKLTMEYMIRYDNYYTYAMLWSIIILNTRQELSLTSTKVQVSVGSLGQFRKHQINYG